MSGAPRGLYVVSPQVRRPAKIAPGKPGQMGISWIPGDAVRAIVVDRPWKHNAGARRAGGPSIELQRRPHELLHRLLGLLGRIWIVADVRPTLDTGVLVGERFLGRGAVRKEPHRSENGAARMRGERHVR